jgi:UDP-3-O-[3-hydroxymyristoyl] N-acetylglucosamine deacetylase
MLRQRTLKTLIRASGVGLHTGQKVRIALRPALPDTGIVFRRIDLASPVDLPARADLVGETRLSSCLVRDGIKVYTVEHLMSALSGLGVDNAYVDLDASELPIMDGSASPFALLLQQAGLEEQVAAKKFLRVKKPVEVREGDKWARLEPHEGFRLSFSIDFRHPAIERSTQAVTVDFAETSYLTEIARARTFGFMKDVAQLWTAGYALGASFENTLVITDDRVLNPEGLRFADEFVRHKVLDAIGDLALAGLPLIGAYRTVRGGHKLNYAVLSALMADTSAWRVVEFAEPARRLRGHGDAVAGLAPAYGPEVA